MQSIRAEIKQGHKIASGLAENSPYPEGSITMQIPHFKARGIDLSDYYPATLNLSIAPHAFEMLNPELTVPGVYWAKGFDAEDFSFSQCEIIFNDKPYKGFIYYPHPDTKLDHFHSASVLEVICQYVPDISYGDSVIFKYQPSEITIS